jgi:hypothetical protein
MINLVYYLAVEPQNDVPDDAPEPVHPQREIPALVRLTDEAARSAEAASQAARKAHRFALFSVGFSAFALLWNLAYLAHKYHWLGFP